MSDGEQRNGTAGPSVVQPDLDEAQLAAAPTLASLDELVIEDLTVEESDAFFAALRP